VLDEIDDLDQQLRVNLLVLQKAVDLL